MKRSYDRIDSKSCDLDFLQFLNSNSNFTPHWKVSTITKTQPQQQKKAQLQSQKEHSTIDWNAKPSYTFKTKSKMLLCSTLTKWTFVFQCGVPSLGKIFFD